MENKTTDNGYILIKFLDKGGMGELWYAENGIEKSAAVKILKKGSTDTDRLKKEAKVMVSLDHPNICQVYDYSTVDNRPCIIMEYLKGGDLSRRMKRGERFDKKLISQWWNKLVDALAYMHEKGIVHRDIKPSNIFLTDKDEIKLLDFGIAKIIDSKTETVTVTGSFMGTPKYMSPEQVEDSKHIDYRSDIYSLAVTFYHLLTGFPPSIHEPLELKKVPLEWQSFLQPYLEKGPKNRPELKHFEPKLKINKWLPAGFILLITAIISILLGINMRKVNPPEPNPKIPIEWADIPAGTYKMGSPKKEERRGSDEYQHKVSLGGFKMSKYEITFEQYDAFCDSTGRSKPDDSGWGRGKRPVINVTWEDAVAFTEWLGSGSRLPTEAEWEYASRARKTTPFHTGNKLTTSEVNYHGHYPYKNDAIGVYQGQTLPVGSFDPNAWGLYDMHGNVCEWCLDWYDEDYYSISPPRNPQGPSFANERVLRGGSWNDWGGNCRSAKRFNSTPTHSLNTIGFRVVIPSGE